MLETEKHYNNEIPRENPRDFFEAHGFILRAKLLTL